MILAALDKQEQGDNSKHICPRQHIPCRTYGVLRGVALLKKYFHRLGLHRSTYEHCLLQSYEQTFLNDMVKRCLVGPGILLVRVELMDRCCSSP